MLLLLLSSVLTPLLLLVFHLLPLDQAHRTVQCQSQGQLVPSIGQIQFWGGGGSDPQTKTQNVDGPGSWAEIQKKKSRKAAKGRIGQSSNYPAAGRSCLHTSSSDTSPHTQHTACKEICLPSQFLCPLSATRSHPVFLLPQVLATPPTSALVSSGLGF